jgi:ATP synthase protein I
MQNLNGIGAYGTVGLDFAVAVAIGTYGGWWLDKKLGWTPWLTIAGLLFGVAAGFNVLYKAAKRMKEETEREDRKLRESERNNKNDGNDDPS